MSMTKSGLLTFDSERQQFVRRDSTGDFSAERQDSVECPTHPILVVRRDRHEVRHGSTGPGYDDRLAALDLVEKLGKPGFDL